MKKTTRLQRNLKVLRKTVRRLGEKSLIKVDGAGPTACCSHIPPCCTDLC